MVAGIGFIGAGAILRSNGGVISGLTTAASLWSGAAIGVLVGTGMIVEGLIVAALDLVILGPMDLITYRAVDITKKRRLKLCLNGEYRRELLESVKSILDEPNCSPRMRAYHRLQGGKVIELSFATEVPVKVDIQKLTDSLHDAPKVRGASWD